MHSRIVTVSGPVVVFCRIHDEWKVGSELPFPRRFWNSKPVNIVLPDVHSELQLQRGGWFFHHRHNHHLHVWTRYSIHQNTHTVHKIPNTMFKGPVCKIWHICVLSIMVWIYIGWHGGAGVSAVASQQRLPVCNLHVLPVSMWLPSSFSSFVAQSKNTYVRWIDHFWSR